MKEEGRSVTPLGRVFLKPEIDQVINCVMGLRNPMDLDAIKAEITNSIMIQHPRFCSLLVRDKHGREHWRRTIVDLEKHILIREVNSNGDADDEKAVNSYLADLAVSSPLNTDKPLWEFHILLAQNCCVLRIHHALGDGTSVMSLFLACFKSVDRPDQLLTIPTKINKRNHAISNNIYKKVWSLWVAMWFNFVFIATFVLRLSWVKDERSILSGGTGVELWPRKLATAKFRLEDMKVIKEAISNATINDVLSGVISCGLGRYMDILSSKKIPEGLQITGLALVNLRPQPGLQVLSSLMENKSGSRWGNQVGFILFPVYYHKEVNDPLQYVIRAKAMLDRKKQSLEAKFSYVATHLAMSLFGFKVATWICYRILCNTSFIISNIVGPHEEIMIGGNPISFLRVNISSTPHAIAMHMVSYAGKADLQILVAENIIPEPQILAKCFEDALHEMKDAAVALAKI